MGKRNLLLCFDAFGTLYKIKQPIEKQYGDVARREFGLTRRDGSAWTDDQLRASFRAAFKAASRQHPNYGHTSGMGASAWWTSVIENTFRPLVGDPPRGLAPRLIERFASSEAYAMAPQLTTRLRALLKDEQTRYGTIVVGVITNSDDRVPDILASMGLRVSPVRYRVRARDDHTKASSDAPAQPYDIGFHCMSYDVGVEKPSPRMFRTAEELLPRALAAACQQQGTGHQGVHEPPPVSLNNWDRVYVGDEWDKDVVGAQTAGWFPVLLHGPDKAKADSIQPLTQLAPQSISELSRQFAVVGIDSIASLLVWLMAKEGGERM